MAEVSKELDKKIFFINSSKLEENDEFSEFLKENNMNYTPSLVFISNGKIKTVEMNENVDLKKTLIEN